MRTLKFNQAIREAIDLCMTADPAVYVLGLGVPDPKGVFGTTLGLEEKHGSGRVLDIPLSENGMTGVAIGSALSGMRPILVHQRLDFALLSMDQIVNQAAKWRSMFGGRMKVPLVIRMIIGRGWGQGPQHCQSLQSWFAHIPGLKVVMPATPHDAKGLLMASVEDDSPVIFLEHRWLHGVAGPVPEGAYRVPLGRARVLREGRDLTIASLSWMTVEAARAAAVLAAEGIGAEVVDIRSLRPFDAETVLASVRKTGRLIVADTGWTTAGFSAEVTARVVEGAWGFLAAPPRRIGLADCPTPSSPALANLCYPRAGDIAAAAREMLEVEGPRADEAPPAAPLDVPDLSFATPF
jgi:acetoin:2,6-dichlorophenolindophenol oxidoreductase subunit beta